MSHKYEQESEEIIYAIFFCISGLCQMSFRIRLQSPFSRCVNGSD
jgi:hypothetical protein